MTKSAKGMKHQKKPPMQKPMTLAEMRVLLMRKEAQLQQCLKFNQEWETVARGFERQKNELLVIVQQLQAERDHWRTLALGKGVVQ